MFFVILVMDLQNLILNYLSVSLVTMHVRAMKSDGQEKQEKVITTGDAQKFFSRPDVHLITLNLRDPKYRA